MAAQARAAAVFVVASNNHARGVVAAGAHATVFTALPSGGYAPMIAAARRNRARSCRSALKPLQQKISGCAQRVHAERCRWRRRPAGAAPGRSVSRAVRF